MPYQPPKHTIGQGKAVSAAGTEDAERRTALRFPFTAAAEVTELGSGARLSARISDLGLEGCYIDALNPFPEGTIVRLRFLKSGKVFEASGSVRNCHAGLGMGIAFTDLTPEQRSELVGWLIERGAQPERILHAPTSTQRIVQLPESDLDLVVRLIHLLVQRGILTEKDGASLLRETLP